MSSLTPPHEQLTIRTKPVNSVMSCFVKTWLAALRARTDFGGAVLVALEMAPPTESFHTSTSRSSPSRALSQRRARAVLPDFTEFMGSELVLLPRRAPPPSREEARPAASALLTSSRAAASSADVLVARCILLVQR
jgi:hypothetical protein